MITLEKIREKVVKQFIARELLENSIAPALDAVCQIALNDYLNIPVYKTLLSAGPYFNNGLTASAKSWNEIQKYLYLDIKTLYSFFEFMEEQVDEQLVGINTKLNLYLSELRDLEIRANGLLLQSHDADFFNSFSEPFSSTLNVDPVSTVSINTVAHTVTCSKKEQASTPLPFSSIIKTQLVLVEPFGEMGKISDSNQIGYLFDGSIASVFEQEFLISRGYNGVVECALILDLDDYYDINSLTFSGIAVNPISIKVDAFSKQEQWKTVFDKCEFGNAAVASFQVVETNKLMITFYLSEFSQIGTSNSYALRIADCVIGNVSYAKESTLNSMPIVFTEGSSAISLYTEEEIPADCDIKYSCSALKNAAWTAWSRIRPVNQPYTDLTKDIPMSVNFVPTAETIVPGVIEFDFLHQYNSGVNMPTSLTFGVSDDPYTSYVLRMPGTFQTITSNDSTYYQGSIYAGTDTVINVGTRKCVLDNVATVNNLVTITKGWHVFRFEKNYDIQFFKDLLTAASITYGYCRAVYTVDTSFISNIGDNEYGFFTFVDNGTTKNVFVKSMGSDELPILYKSTYSGALCQQFKIMATFSGKLDKTPTLFSYHVKGR